MDDLVCLVLVPPTLAAAALGEWGLFSVFGERDFFRAAAFGECVFFSMVDFCGPLRGSGDLARCLSVAACVFVLGFTPDVFAVVAVCGLEAGMVALLGPFTCIQKDKLVKK